nr:MAG: ORF1 [Torque teno midi virus]
MPFWWRRRRKPWFGRWRFRRRTYKTRTNRRRYRRKPRPSFRRRRRRRRRHKVRRKRQRIAIKQWQPDSITKCKIIGLGTLVGGAEGNQFRCYTNQRENYTQPKAPGGGGFGVEKFSLQYLYTQWLAHKNIWTKSNDYKQLCRYTGCEFTFYRHDTTDFVITYDRSPPFDFNKYTYPSVHPQNMLLSKRHRVLLSTKTNPRGRHKLKLKIRPPRQMITKWFFQEDFTIYDLVKIQASAFNSSYSIYGPNSQSPNLTLYSLNTSFYQIQNWQQDHGESPYLPYQGFPQTTGLTFHYYQNKATKQLLIKPQNYKASINMDTGFFAPGVLQAYKVTMGSGTQEYFHKPITVCRYNPEEDTGVGNKVWLTSVMVDKKWQPPSDNDLIMAQEPLYIAFFGFYDFIIKAKKTKEYMTTHMFVVQSPAIKLLTPNTTQTIFPFVDLSFTQGKMPFDELLTLQQKNNWYPTVEKQIQTINGFVESGPFVPKYTNLPSSTWQLTYKYKFFFKWGGTQINDQIVHNPKDQGKYPVPDTILQTAEIADPLKQSYKAMLSAWDFRRGFVTTTALKRMSENQRTDTSVSSDETEPQKKKRKVTSELQIQREESEDLQSCLQELCKENTFQETQDIQQLIIQQQEQQQHLKRNLFKLLIDMKKKQRYYQMQTGLL